MMTPESRLPRRSAFAVIGCLGSLLWWLIGTAVLSVLEYQAWGWLEASAALLAVAVTALTLVRR